MDSIINWKHDELPENMRGHRYDSCTYGVRIDMSKKYPSYNSEGDNFGVVYTLDSLPYKFGKIETFDNPYNSYRNPIPFYKGVGTWSDVIDQFFGARPCILKGDKVIKYLNHENIFYDVDGNNINLWQYQKDNSANFMVEFTKKYYRWRMETSGSSEYLIFEVTGLDKSGDPSWTCDAFRDYRGNIKEKMYYGMFEGTTANNGKILRSTFGSSPHVFNNIDEARSAARNNGSRYFIEDAARRMYIIGLITLILKAGNPKLTNIVLLGAHNGIASPGRSIGEPRNFGNWWWGWSNFLSIENICGSEKLYIDGLMLKSPTEVFYKTRMPYNSTGSGYSIAPIPQYDGYPSILKIEPLSPAVVVPTKGNATGGGNMIGGIRQLNYRGTPSTSTFVSAGNTSNGSPFSWSDTEIGPSYWSMATYEKAGARLMFC